jgi:acyl-CoA thioester hydrolase
MARVKLEFPEKPMFSTDIAIQIGDINYGGHLGNDAVLRLVHEARVRFLQQHGYSEADIEGIGIIMTDAAIVYKSEGFYGDVLHIEVAVTDLSRSGCDFVFRLISSTTHKDIALAKTGIVFFDYQKRRIAGMPEGFKHKVLG